MRPLNWGGTSSPASQTEIVEYLANAVRSITRTKWADARRCNQIKSCKTPEANV